MSSRPVYVPPNKRKRARFHGAFQGGFSAGYFNTVDTKEGWKPSQETKRDQRLEDFMDEQDHEEWGGPTQVRQEYNNKNKTDKVNTISSKQISQEEDESSKAASLMASSSLDPSSTLFFQVSHQTIGPRLLRFLGWREDHATGTNTAFVPGQDGDDDKQTSKSNNNNDNNHDTAEETRIVLSQKKLRQIRLQSSKIRLPRPKLDQCGLGFEALRDAPEFRRHREQREKLARERARGSATTNVYRASQLLAGEDSDGDEDEGHNATKQRRVIQENDNKTSNSNNNDYLSYETMEDFVGNRSVGGFALKDDDDDAYDEALGAASGSHKKPTLATLGDEYNAEVYEHESSDDDALASHTHHKAATAATAPSARKKQTLATDFEGALASWAETDGKSSRTSVGVTSDGRAPIAGFVLGGSLESHKKRYPGPDIPRDYVMKRHEFGPNEHPRVFQTVARAVQLEDARIAQEMAMTKRQQQHRGLPPKPPSIVNTHQFAGLAAAMKNRFTSSSNDETKTVTQSGLYRPEPSSSATATVKAPTSNDGIKPKSSVAVVRTVHSFIPHSLVCKRFGVPAPVHVRLSSGNSDPPDNSRLTRKEEAFFENEIMPLRNDAAKAKAKAEKTELSKTKPTTPHTTNALMASDKDDNNNEAADEPIGVERPPLEKLQSIFEPDSDDESSEPDTDLDSLDGDDADDDDDDDEAKEKSADATRAKDGTTLSSRQKGDSSSALVVHESTGVDTAPSLQQQEIAEYQSDDASGSTSSSRSHRKHKRKKKHRRKDKHRRHRRRKRSRSIDSLSDREERRRRRRRKKSKHPDDNSDDDDDDRSELSSTNKSNDKKKEDRQHRRKRSRSIDSSSDREEHRRRRRERWKENADEAGDDADHHSAASNNNNDDKKTDDRRRRRHDKKSSRRKKSGKRKRKDD